VNKRGPGGDREQRFPFVSSCENDAVDITPTKTYRCPMIGGSTFTIR
jgi:hypothetical protein